MRTKFHQIRSSSIEFHVNRSDFAPPYLSSTAISRVVIRRFCRMSSSTAKIVALLVTTYACPGRDKSLMLTRPVPPHNADTTGIWCTVRYTALRAPLSSCDKFVKYAPLLREEIG
ncbi:hypothetical protein AVEN_237628-1 [Araneus ventricosus]|uniref:Uncharacterized protein n=1 Tax=Araneus ventricosus TaxID=182803 RepID=A0A4Y2JPX7_ARAVE|nr:hypothetical protein AVEN_237628-1 [Araneus ventricosus]